jgi:hypothetical protein
MYVCPKPQAITPVVRARFMMLNQMCCFPLHFVFTPVTTHRSMQLKYTLSLNFF